MSELIWRLSPSIIESYFSHGNCLRSLVSTGLANQNRQDFGFSDKEDGVSAIAQAGNVWEENALQLIKCQYGEDSIISKPETVNAKGETYIPKFDEEEVVSILNALYDRGASGQIDHPYYIYQAGLKICPSFFHDNIASISKEELLRLINGDGKIRIDLSRHSYPDLMRVERENDTKRLLISIVDVKLAKKPKIEHKMQICMYILLLQDLIERNGLGDRCIVDVETGYLFNFGNTCEKGFETAKVLPFLKRFLNTAIPQIIRGACADVPDVQKFFEFPYHISQKCEWCPNYWACIKGCMERKEDIMLLPYLTPYAQDYIRDIQKEDPSLMLSCDGLKEFLRDEANCAKLGESAFWKRFLIDKEENLSMLAAACNGEIGQYAMRRTASCELPESEGVQIVLTSQKDSGYDLPYYWGIRVTLKKPNEQFITDIMPADEDNDVFATVTSHDDRFLETGVIVKDMSGQQKAAEHFVKIWHKAVSTVSSFNEYVRELGGTPDHDIIGLLSLQHFVMDNYELRNFEETLFSILSNNESACCVEASDLLLLLQGQSLVESTDITDRPEKTIDYPITTLTSVIGRLFVLPSMISNSIVDVCGAFFENDEATQTVFDRINNKAFINLRSNVIKNDVINEYWASGNDSLLACVVEYMSNRLRAESILIASVRKTGHPGIASIPDVFIMPKTDGLTCPELRQLRFEALYEYKLAYQNLRHARTMDIDQALSENKLWLIKRTADATELTKNKKSVKIRFELINSDGFFNDDIFVAGICRYDEYDVKALPFYDENYGDESVFHLKGLFKNAELYDGLFPTIERLNGRVYIQLSFGEKWFLPELADKIIGVGDMFLMFETMSKLSLEKNLISFKRAENEKTFVVQPWKFYKTLLNDFNVVAPKLKEYGATDGLNFTKSQFNALQLLYENNITLLLGPPGTGKTNFIARALISLIRLFKDKGKNFKVLVCANSHAAIENVLIQIGKMMGTIGLTAKDIDVRKLDGMKGNASSLKIAIRSTTTLPKLLDPRLPPIVVGSTMWRIHKENFNEIVDRFDLIVLDEASQVRMIDAIIPFILGSKDSTRYLIVGDENQLPPIISGQYEKTPEKTHLLGSVFKYYYDSNRIHIPDNRSYVRQLNDNFRMNRTICDYSAQKIYGTVYRAPNDAIGSQTFVESIGDQKAIKTQLLELNPGDPYADIVSSIMDPEYPLVLCCIHGNTAAEIKNREVDLVTKIVKSLQHLLFKKKGADYGKGEFWGTNPKYNSCGDFGIVSPHHEHINRLKNAIIDSEMPSPFADEAIDDLFIGTVDKLQGQERQMIVVSYGVTDVEQALSEKEFIFSRNRLNVAITRAKKKCIVFLNDAILSYPVEALEIDDQDVIDGLDYVCGLRDYMQTVDDSTNVSVDKDAGVTVYRRQKIRDD